MNNRIIAVDAMGGDHGPRETVAAVATVIQQLPDLLILLFGEPEAVMPFLKEHGLTEHPRITFMPAGPSVQMDESPSQALRSKRDSSMRLALNAVKDGQAQACVSAGNTGALMATARYVLKTIPGIDRPAILSSLPCRKVDRFVQMLDLGANVDSSPENLCQFAVMGSVYARAVANVNNPKVGLLNIGVEDIKGNELVKATAERLEKFKHAINYIGYVEGDDIYQGDVDVIVCDGFVGNIALKASEGLAHMVSKHIQTEFKRNWLTRLSGLLAMPTLANVRDRLDPNSYNGATLLGLQGIVIKSHGSAKARAFAFALTRAHTHVAKAIPDLIGDSVEKLLNQEEVL